MITYRYTTRGFNIGSLAHLLDAQVSRSCRGFKAAGPVNLVLNGNALKVMIELIK